MSGSVSMNAGSSGAGCDGATVSVAAGSSADGEGGDAMLMAGGGAVAGGDVHVCGGAGDLTSSSGGGLGWVAFARRHASPGAYPKSPRRARESE